MKMVVFGLTVSSSWGNGHATLWRGMIRALNEIGHRVLFYEKDVPYYAGARDLHELPARQLRLYRGWDEALALAMTELDSADVAMVTSYCPDGIQAAQLVLDSSARLKVFYDLDTPVTLQRLAAGENPGYLPANGLRDFDLVLSFTGGRALEQLKTLLGARHVAPLYGHVDPQVHRPVPPSERYRADLSYLGTYASDRQSMLERLLVQTARRMSQRKFLIGGALYPQDFPWADNIHFVRHMPPSEHPAFFCSSRLTLNVTRRAMAEMGYCPSGRLFEAAACGTPVLSDWWEGLDEFLTPGKEILIARNTDDAVAAMSLSDRELEQIGEAAFVRVLEEHSSRCRAIELERLLEGVMGEVGATDFPMDEAQPYQGPSKSKGD